MLWWRLVPAVLLLVAPERGYSVPPHALAMQKLSQIPTVPEASSASVEAAADLSNVCPDQRSKCSLDQTCCQTADGSYSCCPISQANCCSDLKSCCPSGYQCAAGGLCQRLSSLTAYPFLPPSSVQQKPAAPPSEPSPAVETEDVTCPDGSLCPDGNTCCPMSSSTYGCCPEAKATCCSDMLHCCPHGYRCADQRCELEGKFLNQTRIVHTSLKKPAAPAVETEDVTCPDGSLCPDGNTCCPMSSSTYGCCPEAKATCCSDMLHCCPHGYRCADQKCELEGKFLNQTRIVHTSLKVESPKLMLAP